jgi:hypothetical protein
MRRVKASHPDYKKLSELANLVAIATNPQAHYWGSTLMDTGEAEVGAIIATLKDEMASELEGGVWRDWIGEMNE